MHQENGTTDKNSSEKELSETRYVPYSERHLVRSEKLGNFLNYLERVIGVDLEECDIEFDVAGDSEALMIWLKNGKNFSINSQGTVGADTHDENGKQQLIFFVMESQAFLQVYQAIIPTIKHNFFS